MNTAREVLDDPGVKSFIQCVQSGMSAGKQPRGKRQKAAYHTISRAMSVKLKDIEKANANAEVGCTYLPDTEGRATPHFDSSAARKREMKRRGFVDLNGGYGDNTDSDWDYVQNPDPLRPPRPGLLVPRS